MDLAEGGMGRPVLNSRRYSGNSVINILIDFECVHYLKI